MLSPSSHLPPKATTDYLQTDHFCLIQLQDHASTAPPQKSDSLQTCVQTHGCNRHVFCLRKSSRIRIRCSFPVTTKESISLKQDLPSLLANPKSVNQLQDVPVLGDAVLTVYSLMILHTYVVMVLELYVGLSMDFDHSIRLWCWCFLFNA